MTNFAGAHDLANAANLAGSAAPSRSRTVAYWAFTLIVAWEMVAGSMWDLLRIEYVRVVLTHLGYPLYLLVILGAWKFPCAIVLLIPGFPRLKEWAYAGSFFNYSGALASHALKGDGPGVWAAPLVFAVLTLGSWALRPPERRLASTRLGIETRPVAWIVPIVVVVVMLVVALFTLPKVPPSF
jgi:DoxX-like family